MIWFTMKLAESGFTIDDVTNCSGMLRCEIMSNVTSVPRSMSMAATTTGTRSQLHRGDLRIESPSAIPDSATTANSATNDLRVMPVMEPGAFEPLTYRMNLR